MSPLVENGQEPVATVVIATHNRREALRDAVQSALTQDAPIEVLVVDDGSGDGSTEMVLAEFPGVRVKRFPTSAGIAARRNWAARAARCPIIVSIDDDAVFTDPGIVAQTLRDFDHPRIGLVAVPFIDVGVSEHVQHQAPDDQGRWTTSIFRGCAYAVRRDVFLGVGGYREIVFHQGEEPDFALRLLDAGWLTRLGRAVPVHHIPSPRRSLKRMRVFGRRNEILLCFTQLPFPSDVFFAAVYIAKGLAEGRRDGVVGVMLQGMARGVRDSWQLRHERRPVRWSTVVLDRRMRHMGPLPLETAERALAPPATPPA
jgi:glycosyltransferase involved in cell wall biosynthesis